MNSWRQPAEILPVMTGTVQEVKLGEAQTGRQGQIPGKESDNGLTFWEGSLFPFPTPTSPRTSLPLGPGLVQLGGLYPLDPAKQSGC